ncbi:hypothetical protein J6A31_04455 [bacterium]|nr:hypothetical protein [bacterium]
MNINDLNEQLEKKLAEKPPHMTPYEIRAQHLDYIKYHLARNPDNILAIPIEEMAELTQHLCKIMRDLEKCDIATIEEIVDVEICLENLKIYFGLKQDTLDYIRDIKLERASRKIEKQTM